MYKCRIRFSLPHTPMVKNARYTITARASTFTHATVGSSNHARATVNKVLQFRPAHFEKSYYAFGVASHKTTRKDDTGPGATKSGTERQRATCQRRLSAMSLTSRNSAQPRTLHHVPIDVYSRLHLATHCTNASAMKTRDEMESVDRCTFVYKRHTMCWLQLFST